MERLTNIDWNEVHNSINSNGFATVPKVLTKDECDSLIQNYDNDALYRSVISMERYRFGKGEHKYFKYPLPNLVETLRERFYPMLVPIANAWSEKLKLGVRYPDTLKKFIAECHEHNQSRPTPLILKYEPGGYNTLHQDLYGDVYFPFQVVFMLTQFGTDHEGGDFVMVEQVPRAQSKAEVVRPNLGDAVVFTTNFRPINGTKGYGRAKLKHGVGEVKSGNRFALGITFHDAS